MASYQLLNNTSRCVNIVAWPLTPGHTDDILSRAITTIISTACRPVSRCLADAVRRGYDGCLWLLISVPGPSHHITTGHSGWGVPGPRMMLCIAPSR